MNNKVLAKELMQTARSYLEHQYELIYSIQSNTFLSGGELYDADHEGRGRIDCSTYMHLVLQGIPYSESPYATGDPEDFYRHACSWADRDLASRLRLSATEYANGKSHHYSNEQQKRERIIALHKDSRRVRRAHQMAQYYWNRGMARTDGNWQPGDLLFFQVRRDRVEFYESFHVFQAIYHVGMVAEDGVSMYESSGNQTVDVDKNVCEPGVRLSKIEKRRAPIFYVNVIDNISTAT